jgi:hypothetical protein
MERTNEVDLLVDRLQEEGEMIGGSLSQKPKQDDSIQDASDAAVQDQETLHKMKRSII